MKFHLHVVDGVAPSPNSSGSAPGTSEVSQSSAVLLFAHMTLRCGHLSEVLAVSASTTPAAARQAQLLQRATPHGAASSSSAVTGDGAGGTGHAQRGADATDVAASEDTQVLQAAGAVLTGAVAPSSAEARALPYTLHPDSGDHNQHAAITPYPYFTTSFAVAEASLRRAIVAAHHSSSTGGHGHAISGAEVPPYFDIIATTDTATFEYVTDFYQQQRIRYGGLAAGGECGGGRGTKPVGVLHVVAEDPSRAARVLQRVLEMVLKRSGYDFTVDANAQAEGEDDEALAAQQQHEEDDDEGDDGYGEDSRQEESNAADKSAGSAKPRVKKTDSWANHIDEAVHLFAQLFSVDVLVALV